MRKIKCIIVTGTSRGLGEALVVKLLNKSNILFTISRNDNEKLAFLAKKQSSKLANIKFDLNNLLEIEGLIEKIINDTEKLDIDGYYLINNAGILAPIKPIDKCLSGEIIKNFNVNALAPMIMTSCFIKMTNKFNVEKRVINISSGAGKKPYYGWGSYCSSKAAIDMFTRCIGVEQVNRKHPVKIISFAPGIIDTDMQAEIRRTKKEDFDQLERFVEFKEIGKLKSADFVAGKVIDLLYDEEIISGSLIDINERL